MGMAPDPLCSRDKVPDYTEHDEGESQERLVPLAGAITLAVARLPLKVQILHVYLIISLDLERAQS